MSRLEELLQRSGVPTAPPGHHHVRAGWVGVDCPSCSPGWGKFRLGFEINSGRGSCWTCGKVDAVAVLAGLCRISLRDAVAVLRRSPDFPLDDRAFTGVLKLPVAGPLLPAHRAYLERRGLDPDRTADIWGIGGIGPHATLGWRILIPISDRRGRVVSWTSRSINPNAEQRYISAGAADEAVPHKEILYGAHLVAHSVIVFEGAVDVWTVGPGTVATCGTGYSAAQLIEISKYPVRAVCFDNQPDAQRRAEMLCRELAPFPGRTENVILETGKDPNEAARWEVAELRKTFLY